MLHRPFLLKHHQNGLQQNLQIQPDAPLVDVARIQLHDFLKVQHIASAIYLPHAGDAWLDCQSQAVAGLIELYLFLGRRAGASVCQVRNNFFQNYSLSTELFNYPVKWHKKRTSDCSEAQ